MLRLARLVQPVLTLIPLLNGVATYYTYEDFGERPLYCDRDHSMYYRTDNDYAWVALPVEMYENGSVTCGDDVLILFRDGSVLTAKALDAGPFSKYKVLDWGMSIVVDVPEHLWPNPKLMSMPATVYKMEDSQWMRVYSPILNVLNADYAESLYPMTEVITPY